LTLAEGKDPLLTSTLCRIAEAAESQRRVLELTRLYQSLTHGTLTVARRANLDEAVRKVAGDLQEAAAERGITINVASANDTELMVKGDGKVIAATIIRPLFCLAIKTMDDNGELSAMICRKADRVELTITDTGYGLSSEEIAAMLSPGRLADHRRQNRAGLGLGAVLAKDFIAYCRATIEIHPGRGNTDQPNRGTIYTLSFISASTPAVVTDERIAS
jgi:signal transduction histidine kinase